MGNDGNPFTLLIVNGSFGSGTVKALQWKLNNEGGFGLTIDGIYGPITESANAFHCGAPENGTLYPGNEVAEQSVMDFQQRIIDSGFPLKTDGFWGNLTTEGLQLSLNSTRF
jgi:hypothetical protein